MDILDVVIIGGGIGGSAAALRAAQVGLQVTWIRGDAQTARASRAKYVLNVDNMIGVHHGIARRKVLDLLAGPEHAAARTLLQERHFHIGAQDIVDDVVDRLTRSYAARVELVDEQAVSARREGESLVVTTSGGRVVTSPAVVLATGVMDRQPRIKRTTQGGKVLDDVRWVFPWSNLESVLYCILCEGHLVEGTRVAVFGESEAAAQVALTLHERYGVAVTLLGNGAPLAASADTTRVLAAYGIEFRPSRIVEILDGEARPKGASLRGFRLEDGETVEARFGMVALGLHRVYNDLARQLGADLDPKDEGPDELRHVLVDDATSETSVRGLFAVGDMSRRRGPGPSMKQIYTAQEYAVRAVLAIDRRRRVARRKAILATAP